MIRVVILGSSASIPTPERNLSAVGIRYFGNVYLFDCGEGTQRQMMKYQLSYAKIKMIFITHLHLDHLAGIVGLMQTLKMIERKESLFIFGPTGTQKYLSSILKITNYPFEVIIKDIGDKFYLEEDDFKITAFSVEHNIESLGYIFQEKDRWNFDKEKADKLGIKGRMFRKLENEGNITVKNKVVKLQEVTIPKKGKKIVYSGDTMKCKNVLLASKDADLLIHDGTFDEKLEEEAAKKAHSTVAEAAEIAKKAKVKHLVLTHISNRYKNTDELEKQAKKIFKNSQIAFDGLEILI
jgi:ribonuclease Z